MTTTPPGLFVSEIANTNVAWLPAMSSTDVSITRSQKVGRIRSGPCFW